MPRRRPSSAPDPLAAARAFAKGRKVNTLQAAEMIGVDPQTVRDWVLSGDLQPPVEVGPRKRVWPETVILQFIADRMAGPRPLLAKEPRGREAAAPSTNPRRIAL